MNDEIKCVVVGDGAIGKTSLLLSYVSNKFPTEYVPTVFENHSKEIQYENKTYTLALCDTAGQEDFDRLRPISYQSTTIFLVCFSVVNLASFHSVKEKWLPEIEHYCPRVPYILVGLQSDLRDDDSCMEKLQKNKQRPILAPEGERLSKEIKAHKYLECSALLLKGVNEIFEAVVEATIQNNIEDSKKNSCILS